VYVFYNPSVSTHLQLGKLSALREIEYCSTCDLDFYYMGFYIHSCQKMIYKASYSPSQLLCPTTFDWIDYNSQAKGILENVGELMEGENEVNLTFFSPLEQSMALRYLDLMRDRMRESNQPKDNTPEEEIHSLFVPSHPTPASVSDLILLVGAPFPFQFEMLNDKGREILQPHLEELCPLISQKLAGGLFIDFS